jgi:phosphoglycolate phosphatase
VTHSFHDIVPKLARSLRLIMTDVDGTLTADGEYFNPLVVEAISRLKGNGLRVGLVSGRTLPRLKKVASLLMTDGPLIAENGGVAQIKFNESPIDLGYSRKPAIEALAKLKAAFPGKIVEREDNIFRTVDVTIRADGLSIEELRKKAPGVQISDSGYMVHIMAEDISKGGTLKRILERIGGSPVSPEEIMVFGDSPTDISLFKLFPNSVLIRNSNLSSDQINIMAGAASYKSDLPVEKGFIQVIEYIVRLRQWGMKTDN